MTYMDTKKRKIFIIFICSIIIICLAVFSMRAKMITNGIGQIESIVLCIYDWKNNTNSVKEIEIKDKKKMEEIYNLIRNSKNVRCNMYPRHSIIEGKDPQYEMHIIYKNGKMDLFVSPENSQYIYRELKNKGYVIGENKAMSKYICKLAS